MEHNGSTTPENIYYTEIRRWLEQSGMDESRLGVLATANARAVTRIKNGTATINTLIAVQNYIKEHPLIQTK